MKFGTGDFELMNLSHIGIAVKDADKTAEFLSSIWKIGKPEVVNYAPTKSEVLFGNPCKIKIVNIKTGPVNIELLQPMDDLSPISDYLKANGEGTHHTAFGVSNYDEMVAKFEKQGHKMLIHALYQGTRWCYFATQPGGMIIELRDEYNRG